MDNRTLLFGLSTTTASQRQGGTWVDSSVHCLRFCVLVGAGGPNDHLSRNCPADSDRASPLHRRAHGIRGEWDRVDVSRQRLGFY